MAHNQTCDKSSFWVKYRRVQFARARARACVWDYPPFFTLTQILTLVNQTSRDSSLTSKETSITGDNLRGGNCRHTRFWIVDLRFHCTQTVTLVSWARPANSGITFTEGSPWIYSKTNTLTTFGLEYPLWRSNFACLITYTRAALLGQTTYHRKSKRAPMLHNWWPAGRLSEIPGNCQLDRLSHGRPAQQRVVIRCLIM